MAGDSEDIYDRVQAFVSAQAEGTLGPADRARLEALILNDPEAARIYARYVAETASLRLWAAGSSLHVSADLAEPDVGRHLHATKSVLRLAFGTVRRRVASIAAALLLIGLAVVFISRREKHGEPPAAMIAAIVDAQWGSPFDALRPGQALPDETMHLKAGLARIDLANGVSMIFQGPSRFRLRPDNAVDLEWGKLTAVVPEGARGFKVLTRSAEVVDLGTEFGVDVAPDGGTHVEVFKGSVTAAPRPGGGPAKNALARLLSAGDAAAIAAGGGAPVVIPARPVTAVNAFVRDLSLIRRVLPLHSTGAGLREGDADSHWQVIAVSSDPAFRPRPAIVVPAVADRYVPNDPAHAQWLSTAVGRPDLPPGTYTFRTTLDLTGFDPRTVVIATRMAFDDGLAELRVNGKSVAAPVPPNASNFTAPHAITLNSDGFVEGVNEIEFVIKNSPTDAKMNSPMALRVKWEGTAVVRPSAGR